LGFSIEILSFFIKILVFSIEILSFFIKILSFSIEILSFFIEKLAFSIEILVFSIVFQAFFSLFVLFLMKDPREIDESWPVRMSFERDQRFLRIAWAITT
jgi:hypothetical protein